MALINPIEKKRKSASYTITVRGDLDDELKLALAFLEETQLQGEETLTLQRLMVEIVKKALQDSRKLIEGFEKKERFESYTITIPGDMNEALEAAFTREKKRLNEDDATLTKFIVQILLKALKDDKAFKNWKRTRPKNANKIITSDQENGDKKEEESTKHVQEKPRLSSEIPPAEGVHRGLFNGSA